MNETAAKTCELCGGTGWQGVTEGNLTRAKRCSCHRNIPSDRLLASAKIPLRYQHCEFDGYTPQGFGQAKAKNTSNNYAADYPMLDDETFREGSLLFTGPSGRGKTHLAVCILKGLLKKGIAGLFVDFHELLSEIRNSYDPLSESSEYEILRPVLNTEVLLLDDLGSQRMSEWVQDTVFHIINLRYNQRKVLIATTNLNLEPSKNSSIETLQDRLGYRVVSRLFEMCTLIELDGPDYRREVRKAGGDFLRSKRETDPK